MLSDRRIKIAWNILKILFSIILVGYFLPLVDLKQLYSLWERTKIQYLLLAVLLHISLTLFKAFMYQQLLVQQKTRYPRVLNIVIVQNSISNFLANSAGLASYLALLRIEENVKVRQSGLVFLIIKIGDLFSVWLVSLVCSFLLWDKVPALQNAILIFSTIAGGGFIIFFLALFWRKGFISIVNRFLSVAYLAKFSFFERLVNALSDFAEMPQSFVFRTVFKAFGLSFLYYMITLLWMIVSMNAFQLSIDGLYIIFVSCIVQLFSMIPVSVFGGLGIVEVTSLYLYSLLGVVSPDLTVVLVGWRILYYTTSLLMVLYLPVYALFIERKIPPE